MKEKPSWQTITSIIAIVAFLFSTAIYIYDAGQKSGAIKRLESENIEIKKQLKEYSDVTTRVSNQLGLLLDYFGIAEPGPKKPSQNP
jgi:hypothetical protein